MESIDGLSTQDAKKRLSEYGSNALPRPDDPGVISVFIRQFLSPLIYILLIAAIVSLFLEEISDAVFIFTVLMINATIGTIQEYSAQRSASALQKVVPNFAKVIRDGQQIQINSEEIVPGDIVMLESGDKVPADIKLHTSQNLSVDESLLTGESVAVLKNAEMEIPKDASLSERVNMAFAGTMVNRGRAQGEVVSTGQDTQIGKISTAISHEAKPPLLIRIEKFTLFISIAMCGIVLFIAGIEYIRGGTLAGIFLIAVALAVSAIPEGLPAAMTVALAIGMRRMASRNVIVRKLLAVESLGSCTFIASDKTGTLTVNELTARRIELPDGSGFDVTGEGVSIDGKIIPSYDGEEELQKIRRLCQSAVLANEATLSEDKGEPEYNGDMVDVAFLVMARKYGLDKEGLLKENPEISKIPYESENGYSASVNQQDGKTYVHVKGSAEKVISMCTSMFNGANDAPINKDEILHQAENLAEQGYRVLALADGTVNSEKPIEEQLRDLTFLGVVGMIDPLRSEAKEAVDLCKKAGIEVAMITGDHPLTARAIATDLGLCDEKCQVVTGKQINEAEQEGEETLDSLVKGSNVFARIEPVQKQSIVQSLMRKGHFVAVTGDGVNDAPALRQAHVGIAMGKRGTDVARENAELILTDDDFASIVKGIIEGRVAYSNIRKVIFLLIATGVAEIILFILSMIAGLPMPLLAVQLLWLNLVTNGIQDVALAFEPAEGDELGRPPRSPNEPIFNKIMMQRVLTMAVYMSVVAFLVFYWLMENGYDVDSARNITLLLMVLFENMLALNSRSETRSVFKVPFFSNPLLIWGIIITQAIHIASMYLPGISDILKIQPVSLEQWSILLVFALGLLLVEKLYQSIRRIREGKESWASSI